MNANESAAVPDEFFKGGLLFGIEDFSCRAHKNHCAIPRQILVGKHGCVFSGIDPEAILIAERAHGIDARRNRSVAVRCGFGEKQNCESRFAVRSRCNTMTP